MAVKPPSLGTARNSMATRRCNRQKSEDCSNLDDCGECCIDGMYSPNSDLWKGLNGSGAHGSESIYYHAPVTLVPRITGLGGLVISWERTKGRSPSAHGHEVRCLVLYDQPWWYKTRQRRSGFHLMPAPERGSGLRCAKRLSKVITVVIF